MKMSPVAQRIQTLLTERKEKLKSVCDQIGVVYYAVYPWWQREHAKPDYESVKLFAKHFGVPVGHLLYGDDRNAEPSKADDLINRIESLEDDERRDLENYLSYILSKRDHQ